MGLGTPPLCSINQWEHFRETSQKCCPLSIHWLRIPVQTGLPIGCWFSGSHQLWLMWWASVRLFEWTRSAVAHFCTAVFRTWGLFQKYAMDGSLFSFMKYGGLSPAFTYNPDAFFNKYMNIFFMYFHIFLLQSESENEKKSCLLTGCWRSRRSMDMELKVALTSQHDFPSLFSLQITPCLFSGTHVVINIWR